MKEYELTDWEPMTPEEYSKVKSKFNEIYMNQLERIQINGEWYVKDNSTTTTTNTSGESSIPQETLLDLSSEICHTRSAIYEDDDIVLECIYSISDEPNRYDSPYIKFLDKSKYGTDDNYSESWDSLLWIWGVYENNFDSIDGQIPKEYVLRVRSFIKYMIDKKILREFKFYVNEASCWKLDW